MKRLLLLLFLLLYAATLFGRDVVEEKKVPTIEQKTVNMKKMPGFFTCYWEEKTGKIWLQIDKFNQEFLYINSLAAGVGSNDIGLDRGQLGSTRIVKFQRVGPKVILLQPNYSFRAISSNPDEGRAVEDAFAQSVLWGFPVAAVSGNRVLVDAGDFFLRDAHHIVSRLKQMKQGNYKLAPSRAVFYLPRTKNFPLNSEFEVMLTYVGEPSQRSFLRSVTPTPEAVTVRLHHSFVQLPDNQYEPRAFDPRSGYMGIKYMDFAAPISQPLVKRFIARHRLKKKDPTAKISEPVKPIIYYIDRGAPEPIRSALMEGVSWWNQAFEAAGYKNAFQVKLMPKGADMLDVRYNVVQWVHRSTRGWSYGGGVTDPRTGEIIKGHVSLGSQRVRQDFLIAQGLLAPYEEGKPVLKAMKEIALARIRQLGAHEVGHTLGLVHNYAASVMNRASVMDYPQPLIKIDRNGNLDWSDAYATGIGEWDKVAIAYGYQDFPAGANEKQALNKIITDAAAKGLYLLTDQDARSPGSVHPLAHLWDNGQNAVEELMRVMKVRAIALAHFSEKNIPVGMPMASLEDVLVPVYFFHRYQTTAAAKTLGGLFYNHALRGDGQQITAMVPAAEQNRALSVLLQTVQPEALAIPGRIINLIPPHAPGYPRSRESFKVHTGLTFDPLAAAEAAADHTVSLIFNPERAARLVEFQARDKQYPGLAEVIDRVLQATWEAKRKSGYFGEIQRVVDQVVLYRLMTLCANENAAAQVRAMTYLKLDELQDWLEKQATKNKIVKDENLRAHFIFALAQIKRFKENPGKIHLIKPVAPPPGSPIGTDEEWFGFFRENPM